MKKLFVTLAIAFASLAQVATAQSRDEFNEKIEATDPEDKKARLAAFDAALKAYPKDADFYLRRGDHKTTMEDFMSYKDTYGFIADYTKAIELDNVSWRYESRANGYMLIKEHKKAFDDATTALKMAEKAGKKEHIFSASHTLGDACMALQDWKGAIANMEKCVQNSEANGFAAAVLSTMSECAKNIKDYASAVKYVTRAMEIYKKLGDKTEGLMYYNRALIKIENLNQKAEGCADLKKAIAIDAEDDMIQEALKKHCK